MSERRERVVVSAKRTTFLAWTNDKVYEETLMY